VLEEHSAAGKRLSPHHVSSSFTRPRSGKSSNLYLGFQCFAADTISNYLFATSFDQLSFPDFQGDIVIGVDKCMATITLAKFSVFFVWMIRYFPPTILMLLAPSLKGLVVFRRVCLNDLISLSDKFEPTLGPDSPGQECPAKPELVGRCTTSCHLQRASQPRGKQRATFPLGNTT